MFNGKQVLAVVPARSGSKGIPDKNIKQIAGKSLIGHVGEILNNVSFLDRKIISTDSKMYIEEAKTYGLDAPFVRPEHLSGDKAGAVETIQHALKNVEEQEETRYDIILITEPTSPLRLPKDIERSVEALKREKADSAVTVSEVDKKFHPRKLLRIKKDRLGYYKESGADVTRRQELDDLYYRNGACYALTRRCLMEKKAIITEKTVPVVIDRPLINIDYPVELIFAECLLEERETC